MWLTVDECSLSRRRFAVLVAHRSWRASTCIIITWSTIRYRATAAVSTGARDPRRERWPLTSNRRATPLSTAASISIRWRPESFVLLSSSDHDVQSSWSNLFKSRQCHRFTGRIIRLFTYGLRVLLEWHRTGITISNSTSDSQTEAVVQGHTRLSFPNRVDIVITRRSWYSEVISSYHWNPLEQQIRASVHHYEFRKCW